MPLKRKPDDRDRRAHRDQHQHTSNGIAVIRHDRMLRLRMPERELLHDIQEVVQNNRPATGGRANQHSAQQKVGTANQTCFHRFTF